MRNLRMLFGGVILSLSLPTVGWTQAYIENPAPGAHIAPAARWRT